MSGTMPDAVTSVTTHSTEDRINTLWENGDRKEIRPQQRAQVEEK